LVLPVKHVAHFEVRPSSSSGAAKLNTWGQADLFPCLSTHYLSIYLSIYLSSTRNEIVTRSVTSTVVVNHRSRDYHVGMLIMLTGDGNLRDQIRATRVHCVGTMVAAIVFQANESQGPSLLFWSLLLLILQMVPCIKASSTTSL
jgi:hypothetical protein